MSKDREMVPLYTDTACNRAAGSQNSTEPSIIDLSYTTMVKWVLNDANIRNRQFNAQAQELTKSLFLQILSFIPDKRKRRKRRKTHQRSPDQRNRGSF